MDRKEFDALATEIMGRADMLALATRGKEEYPSIRALFNLRNRSQFPSFVPFFADKGLTIYLGTNTSSIKVREIGEDPWVSVYFMIPAEFKGLMLAGKALPDEEGRKSLWIEGWERYYPLGHDDPDYRVLKIKPERARGWNSGGAFDFEL